MVSNTSDHFILQIMITFIYITRHIHWSSTSNRTHISLNRTFFKHRKKKTIHTYYLYNIQELNIIIIYKKLKLLINIGRCITCFFFFCFFFFAKTPNVHLIQNKSNGDSKYTFQINQIIHSVPMERTREHKLNDKAQNYGTRRYSTFFMNC